MLRVSAQVKHKALAALRARREREVNPAKVHDVLNEIARVHRWGLAYRTSFEIWRGYSGFITEATITTTASWESVQEALGFITNRMGALIALARIDHPQPRRVEIGYGDAAFWRYEAQNYTYHVTLRFRQA